MADIDPWTGVESDALQEALRLGADEFAHRVGVTATMIYRWRRAGPQANIRRSNQNRLAELYADLNDGQRHNFWAELNTQWTRWRGPGGRPVESSLSATILTGHWVTCFSFGNQRRHADIGEITVQAGRISATNYPPDPRSENRRAGFRHTIDAELVDRQLIGRWFNSGDNYYLGSLHLAVQPGETVLDGVYTGNTHDGQIVAQQWKWVRLDDSSLTGVDLNDIALRDPQLIYALVDQHGYADGPLTLTDVAEAR